MIPQRSINSVVTPLRTHSEQLSEDALLILKNACRPKSERNCAGHNLTVERLKDLINCVVDTNNSSSKTHFHQFVADGFNMFECSSKWALVEQELYLMEPEDVRIRSGSSMRSRLLHLYRVYRDDSSLISPSRVGGINLSELYVYPISWFTQFKALATKMLSMPNGYTKYKTPIYKMIDALVTTRFDPKIVQQIENDKGLNDALNNKEIVEVILSNTAKPDRNRILKALSVFNPDVHGKEDKHAPRNKHALYSGTKKKGAYWIYDLSPVWFQQCQKYIDEIYKQHGQREAISSITRLTKLSSWIVDNQRDLPNLMLLKETGVDAFFSDGGALFKSILEIDENRITDIRNEVLFMHNRLHGTSLNVIDFMSYVIRFDCDSGDDQYRYIFLDSLAKKFPILVQKIIDYANYELNRIDGDKREGNTIFTRIYSVKAVLLYYLNELNESDLERIAISGVDAFKDNNCRIIKLVRHAVRNAFMEGKLKRDPAKQYHSAFHHFCQHFGLPEVKSYYISAKKRTAHERKNKASDYYEMEEAVCIAYAIEMGLLDSQLTQHDELLLRLGRILIKTGWNLTPVLMLSVDDIMQLDAPITGKTAHFVRLFKKRGGYKTQFYEFDLDADAIEKEGIVFGNEVTNALVDLEYIRDNLSQPLRDLLPDNSKLKYRLALYQEDGETLGFTFKDFSAQLSGILKRYECDVPFKAQRIRKGGLNYIYKKVAKQFKEYQKAGQHSMKVFLDVYLRDDGLQREETLASAITVMGDYLAGRPIADDIKIVTTIPTGTKQVPSGRCESKGDDAESKNYAKTHQQLNRDSDTTSNQCSDFNACLFCRHFRLVADAEHVWRLLSYQEYVVGEMQRGVSDYENITDQAEYIEQLNCRVDKLLQDISKINSDAIQEGRRLMNENGCHEDWGSVAHIIGAV